MIELTDRERDVARLVADGLTSKKIAGALEISERRVYALVAAIAYKIRADPEKDDRIQVADWWRSHAKAA